MGNMKPVYVLVKLRRTFRTAVALHEHVGVGWALGVFLWHCGKSLWHVKSLHIDNYVDAVEIEAIIKERFTISDEDPSPELVAHVERMTEWETPAEGYFWDKAPKYSWDSAEIIGRLGDMDEANTNRRFSTR